jgi:hypothetical protein
VRHRGELTEDAHGAAEFLLQFAMQRGFGAFSRLDLATGELPLAGQFLAGRTLRQQDAALFEKDGADDGDGRDGAGGGVLPGRDG